MDDSNATPLRRLPWDGPEGKAAYAASDGGVISRLADRMEDQMLLTAKEDTIRAADLCQDDKVSRAELRIVVGYLARAVGEAVLVADLRGERLSVLTDSEEDDGPLAGVPLLVRQNDLH
jgi:predicted RNA-binding protein